MQSNHFAYRSPDKSDWHEVWQRDGNLYHFRFGRALRGSVAIITHDAWNWHFIAIADED
jgi:hypothetical protein